MSIGFTPQTDNSDKSNNVRQNNSARQRSANVSEKSSSGEKQLDDLRTEDMPKGSSYMYVGIVVVLIVVILVVVMSIRKTASRTNSSTENEVTTTEAIITTEATSEEVDTTVTSVPVTSGDEYVSDLDGLSLESNYDVVDKTYYRDFANYEMRRAEIDDGMEMYWLEISYEGKSYRCQIPYYAASTMELSGICVVEIEKLTLSTGSTVISFMQVVYDYDELLDE
jgi:hypothetical protein